MGDAKDWPNANVTAPEKTWPDGAWTPRAGRKGTWCSPACGYGCTRAQYDEAREKAKKLVERLKKKIPGKWKADVWENMGWFYAAKLGELKVHPFSVRDLKGYTAYLGETEEDGGLWVAQDAKPERAAHAVLDEAAEYAEKILGTVEKIRKPNK